MITKNDAIVSLVPNSSFSVDENGVVNWISENLEQPTEIQIQIEIARLQSEYEAKEYQRLRAKEYPPITDYLDGIVKGDEEQVQAYIDKCLEIKAKYPKG
jgi:hypothetical protein